MDVATQNTDEMQETAIDADRLRVWLEGERAVGGATDLFLETGASLERAATIALGDGAVIFAPEDDDAAVERPDGARVVRYTGALEVAGGEIGLSDDVIVQTESYATAPYVSIAVPTAFSVVDDLDLAALRADASAAHSAGFFPAYLTTPLATLVDQRRWLSPLLSDDGAPRRLLLSADGTLRDGPRGAVVPDEGVRTSPAAPGRLDDAVELARFVGAAKVVRALQSRLGHEVSIAGYGGRSPSAGSNERTDAVFVASDASTSYVVDIATNRLDRVPGTVAELVEQALCARAAGVDADPAVLPAGSEQVFRALGLDRFVPASSGRPL